MVVGCQEAGCTGWPDLSKREKNNPKNYAVSSHQQETMIAKGQLRENRQNMRAFLGPKILYFNFIEFFIKKMTTYIILHLFGRK